jgi:L-aminopeptidase/D-esterase-like protein
MEERGRGHAVNGGVVPIVPAAVIFDLAPCGRFDRRPTPEMAYAACDSARSDGVAEGSIGAGTGATVGKAAGIEGAMKGGVGCAIASEGALAVFALAVVNALGDVRDDAGRIIAGARGPDGAFLDATRLLASGQRPARPRSGGNTTLSIVATSAPLSRIELAQLARSVSAALHRRVTPTGTSFDGDVVFALSPIAGENAPVLAAETLAVRALERAVERGVRLARGRDGIPGLADDDRSREPS